MRQRLLHLVDPQERRGGRLGQRAAPAASAPPTRRPGCRTAPPRRGGTAAAATAPPIILAARLLPVPGMPIRAMPFGGRQAVVARLAGEGPLAQPQPLLQHVQPADVGQRLRGRVELQRLALADDLPLLLGHQVDVAVVEHAVGDDGLGEDALRLRRRQPQRRLDQLLAAQRGQVRPSRPAPCVSRSSTASSSAAPGGGRRHRPPPRPSVPRAPCADGVVTRIDFLLNFSRCARLRSLRRTAAVGPAVVEVLEHEQPVAVGLVDLLQRGHGIPRRRRRDAVPLERETLGDVPGQAGRLSAVADRLDGCRRAPPPASPARSGARARRYRSSSCSRLMAGSGSGSGVRNQGSGVPLGILGSRFSFLTVQLTWLRIKQ